MALFSTQADPWQTINKDAFAFHDQVLLSNGSLISILVSSSSGDIEKISLDKTLTGKVPDAVNKGMQINP